MNIIYYRVREMGGSPIRPTEEPKISKTIKDSLLNSEIKGDTNKIREFLRLTRENHPDRLPNFLTHPDTVNELIEYLGQAYYMTPAVGGIRAGIVRTMFKGMGFNLPLDLDIKVRDIGGGSLSR